MSKVFILFVISLLAHKCSSAKGKCNMTNVDVDNCSRKIMLFGDRDNLIPANNDEMDKYCTRMQEGIRCIRHYARSCLPSFPQQIFGMFAYDARTVMRRQCKTPEKRTEFIKNISCFLPKPYMEPLHLCIDKYIVQLEVIKTTEPSWRIPGICCTFHLLQDCIRDNTQTLCEKKTGMETVDYIMNIINSLTDDVLDFTCGPYRSVAKCDELMEPESWKKMKETIDPKELLAIRSNHRFFSPAPLLVEIIADYDM